MASGDLEEKYQELALKILSIVKNKRILIDKTFAVTWIMAGDMYYPFATV